MAERQKMSIESRAKQFMPFAALKGLEQALAKKEKIVVEKIELSDDMKEELDRRIHNICKGMIVTVIYYENEEYLKTIGMVARIDTDNRVLQVVENKINFENIYSLDYTDKHSVC